jgi:SAM-dependent methyltransferase
VSGYGPQLAAVHAAGFTALATAAVREALTRLPQPGTVLDMGCGDGSAARTLVDAGHRVSGIDLSPAFVRLARRRVPEASFSVGSFVDASLPAGLDAILAIGEVLGYASDHRVRALSLHAILERLGAHLAPGGFMLFDLATPERASAVEQRDWVEGAGWSVLVATRRSDRHLRRRIITYTESAGRGFERGEETHELVLHPRAEVLRALRDLGFAARTLPQGYAGEPMPHGIGAYLARRR